jgi:HEAT repeats
MKRLGQRFHQSETRMFWNSNSKNKSFKLCLVMVACCTCLGCHDGPLYALKVANPYYSMNEWKKDEAIGVTDHERRTQLAVLADTIGTMPTNKQTFWSGHLEKLIENDESPEMRRLAVKAAGQLKIPVAANLIEKGLDDDSSKVRMEACNALAGRKGDESIRSLAAVAGTETDEDVRNAAIAALGKHRGPLATDALKVALSDRNPATRDLDGKPTRQVETRLADRVRELF